MEVPIDSLELGLFTSRMAIDYEYVKKLSDDISHNGLQKPILVRPHPKTANRFQVVDGNHRTEACKLAGFDAIKAEVRQLSDEEATFLAMHLNLWRGKGLTPLEQGRQLWRLQNEFELSQEEIGKKFRRSQQWVSERINIWLRSSDVLKNSITARAVTYSHARKISQLPENDQTNVVEKVRKEKLNVRQTAVVVNRLKRSETKKEKHVVLNETPLKSPFLGAQTEEELNKIQDSTSMIETFNCPHCHKPIIINFVTHEFMAKMEETQ
jgi:ParB family chromosome partitioning protein